MPKEENIRLQISLQFLQNDMFRMASTDILRLEENSWSIFFFFKLWEKLEMLIKYTLKFISYLSTQSSFYFTYR